MFFFQNHNVNLTHIESRPNHGDNELYDFIVDCKCSADLIEEIVADLNNFTTHVNVLSRDLGKDSKNDASEFEFVSK